MNSDEADLLNPLQATLGKMALALDTIAEAVVWIDDNRQVEWCNSSFDRLTNQPHDAIIGAQFSDLLRLNRAGHPVAPEAYPDVQVRQANDAIGEYELCQGTTARILIITGNCFRMGRHRSVVLTIRDVTCERQITVEQQKAEQEQERYVSLLQATLESTADGVLVVTRDRNTPVYNQKFVQMWDVPEELMQPGRADDRLTVLSQKTKDPDVFLRRVWQLFLDRPDETALELLELKNGRIFERYSQPQRIGDQIVGRVWSFRDVTEHKRTETALQRQAAAIRASNDGIAILGIDQTYLYLNDAHIKIYGYDRAEELIGRSWQDLYDEVELQRFEAEIIPVLFAAGQWQGETIGLRKDGSHFPQEIFFTLLQSGELVCVVRDITQRKQTEIALRQAEERYRSIFENAVVGIYQTTPEGRYLNVNPTLARIHGYESPQEMIAAFTDIQQQLYVHPDRRVEFKQRLAEQDTITEFESEVYCKDGGIIWVSENARAVRDATGTILYYEGTSIEITDRKRAEQALRDSEERLRLSLSAGSMGIWDWNILTGEVKWSDNLEEVHGMEPGSFKGTFAHFLDIVHPHDRQMVSHAITHAVSTGTNYDIEFRILWANGSVHWIAGKGQTFHDEAGKAIRMIGVGMSITDRKHTEAALRESEARFRAIFESAAIGSCLADVEGRIVQVNPVLQKMLGYNEADFRTVTFAQFTHPDDIEIDRTLTQAVIAGTRSSFQLEKRYLRKNGGMFWGRLTLSAIRNPGGEVQCTVALIEDITDRKRTEEALQTSELKFRRLFESSQMGIYRSQIEDGLILDANRKFIEGAGYDSAAEVIGKKHITEFYADPNYRRWIVNELHQTGEINNLEMQFRRRDGSVGWGLFAIRLNLEENCVEGVVADITDRKHAAEALRRSELKYRNLFENSQVGIYRTRLADGLLLDCNQRFLDLLGYHAANEVIHKMTAADHYSDLKLRQWVLEQLQQQGELQNFEMQYRHRDGSLHWGLYSLRLNREEDCIDGFVTCITDRKHAEEALRESEAQYRDLVETANCIILRWDSDGMIKFINDYGQRFFGFNASEILYHNVVGTIVPETETSGRDLYAMILDICRHPQNYLFNENENSCKNGDLVWIVWANRPIFDADGNLIEILSVGTDATDRKHAEQALQQSELKFRTIVENANDIIYVHNQEGKFTYISPNVTTILGYSVTEAEGQPFNAFIHPDDLETSYAAFQNILGTGHAQQNLELRTRHRNQSWRWFSCNESLIYDIHGTPSVMGVARDITERKQAEEALRRSELKYRNIFENSQVGIGRTRLQDGLFLEANHRCAEILGFSSPADLIGRHSTTTFHLDGNARQNILTQIEAYGEIRDYELPMRHRDGGTIWVLLSLRLNATDACLEFVMADISDRKRLEEELRQREQEFRALIENAPDIIVRFDRDSRYLYINPRVEKELGIPPAAFIGKTIREMGFPETLTALWQNTLDRAFQTAEAQSFEFEMTYREQITYHSARVVPEFDDAGTVASVLVISRDMTDRKQLEEDLQQSRQFLNSIIDSIPMPLFAKDINNDFRYVLINKNSELVLGFSREGAIGRSDYELVDPKQAEFYRQQDQIAVEHGALLEIPEQAIQVGDSTILTRILKLPLFDPQGNPTHLLCICEDITERKQREEALRLIVEGTASKTGDDFFHTCVRYLAEVLQVHCAFVTEWADEAHSRVRTLAFWMGGDFCQNIEFSFQGTPCENVIKGKKIYFYPSDVPALFPGDPYIAVLKAESYMGIPLLDSDGEMLGYLAVTDTKPMSPDPGREMILKIFAARAGAELERNQAETALMLAKNAAESANRSKSIFLANMSHELRTPLNAILGFAQLMERDPVLTARQRTSLATINRSGEHLLDLINDVLEMSKIEAGRIVLHPAPFDLHLLLNTLREMFQIRAEAKQLSLQFELAADLPQWIWTDEGKLRQVLTNLLSNAVKFTQQGRVTLRVGVRAEGKARSQELGARSQESGVRSQAIESTQTSNLDLQSSETATPCSSSLHLYFEVEDTGRGIAPKEMDQLFQPFVQTSSGTHTREGTGLGLTISRQFVRLMGGDIWVTSGVGQGSTFGCEVMVRVADPAEVVPPQLRRRVIHLAPEQPIYRVLIVDDRPENRDLIAQLLDAVGFATRTANDGAAAIAYWQTWHPHLIWMDMRMPVMDGYEATRQIRRQQAAGEGTKPEPKIIALTASAFEEQRANILTAGCDDLVAKPFKEHEIFEKMAEHLGVQYLYAEPAEGEKTQIPGNLPAVSCMLAPSSLQIMPIEWIADLHQAALAVDADRLLELIQQIPMDDRALAEGLQDLVHRFCFDEILELTQADREK
ncbi:MAG: PAS domain S-box protein [Scytolyngbya sp. HA4215-MV1]|nr:PAS domain S-box protein [Scytolyngbya sp. HA4215-MV1]